MGNPTRARLMNLGKTQVDLLREIRKRGYPKCTEPYLSKVNNGLNRVLRKYIAPCGTVILNFTMFFTKSCKNTCTKIGKPHGSPIIFFLIPVSLFTKTSVKCFHYLQKVTFISIAYLQALSHLFCLLLNIRRIGLRNSQVIVRIYGFFVYADLKMQM